MRVCHCKGGIVVFLLSVILGGTGTTATKEQYHDGRANHDIQPQEQQELMLHTLAKRTLRMKHNNNPFETNKRNNNRHLRILAREQPVVTQACDAAFMDCMGVGSCTECFLELQTRDVDWASVTQDTTCEDILTFLLQNKMCTDLSKKSDAKEQFCTTFRACVVWDDCDDDYNGSGDDARGDDDDNADIMVDCSTLTRCDWPGFHPSFLGNGICNDGIYGCYNTAICGWDGGDCCEDTCELESNFIECGHDGYYCRDPKSKNCNSLYSINCNEDIIGTDDNVADDDEVTTSCGSDETPYRIIMYDSFGDGWDSTTLTLSEVESSKVLYTGSLKTGSQGTHQVCLSKSPRCYNVQVKGGMWGNEVSFEIKPMTDSPAIAGGGAPMDCNFGVAGMDNSCEVTCNGRPNINPSDDPDYKDLKDLYHCIEEKCMIQQSICEQNDVCKGCFSQDEETHDYCYANDAFNALVDCSLCKCTDRAEESSYCSSKMAPGKTYPPPGDDKKANSLPDCSPAETLKGGSAVMAFGACSDIDQVSMMVTDFDENNFGDIDKFEACAHSFASKSKSRKTALDCMQILVDAKNGDMADEDKESELPKDAIAALAKLLYEDAENFCDCAKKASEDCPLCSSFVHFKTLLYETLDACQSLDEIDCDAWKEFYGPCKGNLENKFGKADFARSGQCDYVHNGCDGAGPFPSFRRLDCRNELDTESWNFYQQFAQNCVDGFNPDDGYKPAPEPAPAPSSDNDLPVPTPSDDNKPGPKPYVPPEDRGKPSANKPTTPYSPSDSSSDGKSSSEKVPKKRSVFSKFLRLVMLAGVIYAAYYVYKSRSDGFNFVRYRRMRHNYHHFDDQDMYSGLSLESSTNFEPPTLPPTPMQS